MFRPRQGRPGFPLIGASVKGCMMAIETDTGSPSATTSPLLSHTTILILSIFLIGFVSGQSLRPDVRLYGFGAGAAGMFIYFLLDVLEDRRKRKKRRRAASKLSNRLDKHVPRRSPTRWMHANVQQTHAEGQYLPVAFSSKMTHPTRRPLVGS